MPSNSGQPTQQPPLGAIKLRRDKRAGTLTYVLKGGHQSAVDKNGVSVDTYIHALYGLVVQRPAKRVLMIGCGGGLLGKMLSDAGLDVTIVDIDARSFTLARKHFGLPEKIICKTGDGLAFMEKTRRRFDVLIIDAFIGENIPPQFTGPFFARAARRCLAAGGRMYINVCLSTKADLRADKLATRLMENGWLQNGGAVRLLDQRGPARNCLVLAGKVKGQRRPPLHHLPATDRARLKREFYGMRFRPVEEA